MVSSNWFPIPRIGPMMAINLILIPTLSALPPNRVGMGEQIISREMEAKSPDDPLLGAFEISENGESLLYCNEKDPTKIDNAFYLTIDGDQGRISKIQSIQNEYTKNKNDRSIGGKYFENINNNEQIYFFKGRIGLKKIKQGTYSIGLLLRSKCVIEKKIDSNKYCINYMDKKFEIESARTKEGMHYKSLALPSRSEHSHYYFYLGYETE